MPRIRRIACACLVMALVTPVIATSRAAAGDRCAHCGCCANLCKVCRAVPEVKEVKKVCWDVKCEDFCVPGCSKCCGTVEECDKCGRWSRTVWSPGCAEIYTHRTPVKTEVVRKVPTTKWVVETVCADCRKRCCATDPPSTAQKIAAVLSIENLTSRSAPATSPPQQQPAAEIAAQPAQKKSWLTSWMK